MTQEERNLNDRYRLEREIGRGGMAVIWEARDLQLDRRVAVKLLHPQFASDPEFVERFRREARAAASLAHPSIVQLFDVGETEGTPFLVMELVEGESLKERLRREGTLPERDIRAIGAQVAEALAYAHTRDLIHRDVKPQNILLGSDGRAWLADFGIAQALSASSLTRTGAVMGSVHYMAPEVIRGLGVTPAADLYGLGAVLYEMATGQMPFRGDSDMAVALAHVEQTPPAPRSYNPSVSRELDAIIMMALAKHPRERFPSGQALAQALRDPTLWPPPVAQATQAMGAAAVGATGGATTLLAGAATDRPRAAPIPRGRAVPAPPPARQRVARPAATSGGGSGMLAFLFIAAAALAVLGVGLFGLATLNRDGSLLPPPGATASPTPQGSAPVAAVSPTSTRTLTATATSSATSTSTPTPTPSPTPSPTATATLTPTQTPTLTPTPTTPPTPTRTATPAPPTATPTPQGVAVPNVLGTRREQAERAIRDAGLQPTVQRVDAPAPEDVVVGQRPESPARVADNAEVTLLVATGELQVPDVTGRPQAEAVRILSSVGFPVGDVRRVSSATVQEGVALGTDPPAGRPVRYGRNVDLVVSSGR